VDRNPRNIAAALAELKALFGDRLSTSLAVREQHGAGFSYHKPRPADAVLFALSTQEVQQTVRICAQHRTPVIPYGTGTSDGRTSRRTPWRRLHRRITDG